MLRSKYFALAMPLLLTACFSDNDNKPNIITPEISTQADPVPNVALTELKAPLQTIYQPGQPITLDYSISSELLDTQNIGVTFMAIPKDKVAQLETEDKPEGFNLGLHHIEQLQDGTQNFTATLMFPNEQMPSGEYLIGAYVDSAKNISDEANLDDNRSRGHDSNDLTTYAQITIDSSHYHDFVLDKATVGDGFAMFPEFGPRDAESEGNPSQKRSDIIGHIDASKFGNTVNSADVTAEIIIEDQAYTAHFWQEGQEHYAEKMRITFAQFEQSHYFPYDIAINGALLHKIRQAYDANSSDNTFDIRFTLHDTSEFDEALTNNNSYTLEVPYSLYRDTTPSDDILEKHNLPTNNTAPVNQFSRSMPTDDLAFTISQQTAEQFILLDLFSNTYGDKSKVAVVPSFLSLIILKATEGGYAWASSGGGFDLYMFDDSVDLFSAGASGVADGANGTVSYSMGVSLLGKSLISESDSVTALDESYTHDWSEEQKLFSTTFTIAIVPVSVSAGIKGEVGVGAELKYEDQRFSIGGDILTASLDAYATAGIDLLIASGGIGIDFLIISETLSATAYTDISKAISDSEITYGIDVSNHMKAIEGELYLWVKYPGYEFCCSFPTKTATKTLYDTGALYNKTWQMLDYSDSFKF
ncbi:hypothetical protein [Pseudoalteromonas luteoviolacea]|uniref:Uncharacterized protein n=1 Tax=Pseudoalteromonas luteoviolacea S4054 TaxID=1129367 RepID=A0A0F6A5Y2_9GAMM|nr:hypothetical protein [Pseudoalteromonas luteoviolacea]AOT09470.1 hypothetical protein S4054249_17145 [Pseudoalteromonas luteoviolacea]AOT14382.1 hypothetical protein S40542_17115 [Pseudoalteromonas luteoviolacea]AOT19298.1 hypothetical protein S4054_17120 [Pseudoalteromonas luteoviolacea]KKE81622.1 hypothetical protein N479_21820 [Pseudoalteromonas luteoviolacea S4054]KZN72431.1 hypothetical protein N481_15260 [Pseudoalteromonas luteoviolacea S4047-1]